MSATHLGGYRTRLIGPSVAFSLPRRPGLRVPGTGNRARHQTRRRPHTRPDPGPRARLNAMVLRTPGLLRRLRRLAMTLFLDRFTGRPVRTPARAELGVITRSSCRSPVPGPRSPVATGRRLCACCSGAERRWRRGARALLPARGAIRGDRSRRGRWARLRAAVGARARCQDA